MCPSLDESNAPGLLLSDRRVLEEGNNNGPGPSPGVGGCCWGTEDLNRYVFCISGSIMLSSSSTTRSSALRRTEMLGLHLSASLSKRSLISRVCYPENAFVLLC